MRKVMVVPEKKIFRQNAITAYKRSLEKADVPRLISWPIIVCLWLLLGVLIAACFLAWYVQVPNYVDGSGIILARGDMLQPAYGEMVAVIFLPPVQAAHLRVGLPVKLQIGTGDLIVYITIAQVSICKWSPNSIRQYTRL